MNNYQSYLENILMRLPFTIHSVRKHRILLLFPILLSSLPLLAHADGLLPLFLTPLVGGEGSGSSGSHGSDCVIPAEAKAEDTRRPDHVIGNGTAASCTSEAVVNAVKKGGIITFDCGPAPITIVMKQTAKIVNNTGPKIVIDGGGKVTLSGDKKRRILYMNTCDQAQGWTTSHCQDQDHPQLTVQNLTFVDGNVPTDKELSGGGSAIWVRGGRFKLVNTRFHRNTCVGTGPDVGGAVRVFSQYRDLPVYVNNSIFGGSKAQENVCSNGGGISSIGVSWTIYNSLFSYNRAIGNGGNPSRGGTPGGGSGGAIYNDGKTMTLSLCGTTITNNEANTHGPAIFFVSNNHDGTIRIEDSVIQDNINHSGHPWEILPGISGHLDTTVIVDEDSIIK